MMPTSSPMPRRRLRPMTTDSPGGRIIGFRPLPSTGRKWYVIASKFRCPGRPPRPPSAPFSGPYRGTSSAALDIPSLDYCAVFRVVIIALKSADLRRLAKTLFVSLPCGELESISLLASARLREQRRSHQNPGTPRSHLFDPNDVANGKFGPGLDINIPSLSQL